MNNPSNIVYFNWQNGLIGKLAKHLANHLKTQCLQYLTLNWQIGNCQLNLPICQLDVTPYIYRVFVILLIGEKTPLYNIIITLTLIIIFIGVCARGVSV